MATERENADSGTLGIELHENCTNRCWSALREPCRCPCGGRNHGVLQPGSTKLVSPGGCAQLQTVMGIQGNPGPEAGVITGKTAETLPDRKPGTGRTRRMGPGCGVHSGDRCGEWPGGWRPAPEDVRRVLEGWRGQTEEGIGPPGARESGEIGLEAISAYLEREYRTPASLQERVDREAERCALEILAQAARPGGGKE